jgi:hypothetical protein
MTTAATTLAQNLRGAIIASRKSLHEIGKAAGMRASEVSDFLHGADEAEHQMCRMAEAIGTNLCSLAKLPPSQRLAPWAKAKLMNSALFGVVLGLDDIAIACGLAANSPAAWELDADEIREAISEARQRADHYFHARRAAERTAA